MNPSEAFISELGPLISRYLAMKEALGCRYQNERAVLRHLDGFLARQAPNQLTAETFSRWVATLAHLTPTVRRNRMRIVRNFCLYRRRSITDCFVPDATGFPRPHQSQRPHLFTELQIVRLLHAADRLEPTSTSPLYREGMRLAIVLLYTSGLRRGELVRLTLGDYTPAERTLRIRDTKFHKSRLVPLSCDAVHEMDHYLHARRRFPHAADAPLLCIRHGGIRAYSGAGLAQGLQRLFEQAQIRTERDRLPRIHDLRHTFAIQALRRWYRDGVDVQSKLPALSAYMGHVSVVSTQYYLTFLEPFAEALSERFASHCAPLLISYTPNGAPS
jgi:integrase